MHLMIPHASALDDACKHTRSTLPLEHLAGLLGLLKPSLPALGRDEYDFNTPFEQALAQLRGWAGPQGGGLLPTAAWAAQAAGLDPNQAWALLTPLHLAVGSDQVSAYAPAALDLSEGESQAFFQALAELWPAAEGWKSHWLSRHQWLISHPSLAALSSASLERVLQRNVDAWMPEARLLRRLQMEAQMLLHREPLNSAREARGALALNSVWISGCGADPGAAGLPTELQIDTCLQEPLLNGDWATWAEAWTQLDNGAIAALLQKARSGEAPHLTLTLCGERHAQSYGLPARSALQKTLHRWLPPRADAHAALDAL